MQPFPPDGALAIVVVPLVGGAALNRCLSALQSQSANEILVVSREPLDLLPGMKLVPAPAGSSVPQRRMIGLQAATAPIVVFIEDTCVPSPDWGAALIAAFAATDVDAVGGPVHTGPSLSAQSRALAISEYSRFSALETSGASEVKSLAGANFAVRRKTFASNAMPDGLVDHLVFDAIREAGGRILFEPKVGVTYSAGPADHVRLSTRFHHGRIYGGLFAAKEPLGARLRLALLALAVPIVLVMRNLRDAGPQLLRSPATLWWIVLMQCAWGCGEVVGKLTGKVGESFKAWA